MYPVGIFCLDRCLQGANNIKEDSVMENKQREKEYWSFLYNSNIGNPKKEG